MDGGDRIMKKEKKSSTQFYILIAVYLVFIILVVSNIYNLSRVKQDVAELKNDLGTISRHNNSSVQTEYTQAIDFLENEMVKYREFIEKQQDYLIWLVGLIGVGATGLIALFEIKGRKDISRIIRENYADQFEVEMDGFIGGKKRVAFLKNCVEKEEQAKQRKILFLFQDEENENLKAVYNILKNQDEKFQINRKIVSHKVLDKEIDNWTEENNILIYQVDKKEFKVGGVVPDKNIVYDRIAKKCNDKKVYCVLYCENNMALERALYDKYFYVNNANYGLTLMERLFNLLYFV